MNIRRVLLRAVFVSLALTAVFGAAGVIFAGHDTLWRIVGTCGATALAALALLGAARLIDVVAMRRAGLTAVILIVVDYLLGLGLIWSLFADDTAGQIGLSMVALMAAGGAAVVFFAMLPLPRTRLAGWIGIAVAIASFLAYETGIWLESSWAPSRWAELGNTIASIGLLAAFGSIGAGTDRRHWRWLGVVASTAALWMSVYGLIFDLREPSAIFTCIVCVALVTAHANLVVLCPLTAGQSWLLRATVGAGTATGLFVALGSLTAPWQQDALGRLAGAAAILAGCGTLALVVLTRINAGRAAAPGPSWTEVRVYCPGCGELQTRNLGVVACASCGLRIAVTIEPQAG